MHIDAKYIKLEKLGEGTYANVFKGTNIHTNETVALKEIKINAEEGAPSTALREIALLKRIQHPNIIRIWDVIHSEKVLTLVFEFLECDLKRWMDTKKGSLSCSCIRGIMLQLLAGLSHCHSHKIMHRDLKPQNLLLTGRGELKIGDFGLARVYGIPVAGFSSEVVTLWYRAPDVLLGSTTYSYAIDMWSVGCIMGELFLGKPMFAGKNKEDQLMKIFSLLGVPNANNWPNLHKDFPTYNAESWSALLLQNAANGSALTMEKIDSLMDDQAKDLMMKLLQFDPQKRITATEAMKHPFFEGQ